MTYRVKDYNKNILVEYVTVDEFNSYVSSSLTADPELVFFEYDLDIYDRMNSGSLTDHSPSLELYRITYNPFQDDVEEGE